MYRIAALAVALLTTLHASARAQTNDVISATYGKGVHAYFAGRYVEAYEHLTAAIDAGSKDPRCYYFRGLSYLKLGREPEAKADFARGAELEMADTTRFYNVSKALERCQGRARALLERYRADARLAAFRQRERIRYERYERIRRVEPEITLQPLPGGNTPEEQDDNPPPEMELEDEPAAEEMPADEDLPAEAQPDDEGAAEEMPAEEMPAEEDPFSDDGDDADDASDAAQPAETDEEAADADGDQEMDDPAAEDESAQ